MPSAIRVTLSSNSRRRSYTVPIRGSSAVRYASMRSRTLGANVWRWSKSPSTLDRRNAMIDTSSPECRCVWILAACLSTR